MAQIKRSNRISLAIDCSLDDKFIVILGSGRAPAVVEDNRCANPGKFVQYLDDGMFA